MRGTDMHAVMIHACIQVPLPVVAPVVAQVYRMPRSSGIGRTGKKHKKAASHDLHRQPKLEAVDVGIPLASSAGDRCVKVPGAAPLPPSPTRPAALPAASTTSSTTASEVTVSSFTSYIPQPHPNYKSDKPFPPGFRGCGGAYGDEKWDPFEPPCIPSDERPANIFGSEEAARAAAAASYMEQQLPDEHINEEGEVEEDEYHNEEAEEMARVRYKHALRRLASAFPELDVDVARLCAGLPATEQNTRPCPCGAGVLARWPWVVHSMRLGFCPGTLVPNRCGIGMHKCGRCSWEFVCWRSEWVNAWPKGRDIAY